MVFVPRIPPMPQARMHAFSLVSDEDVTIPLLTEAARADPALAGSVLRAANSAVSAPLDRIGNLRDAVVRIGLEETRRIIRGAVLRESFTLDPHALDVDALWRHLATVAILAEDRLRDASASDAFTAGLLHDVGRMAMAAEEPSAYARVRGLVARGVPAVNAERAVFGHDHLEVGVEVAQAWRLPDAIIEAIGWHHSPGLGSVTEAVVQAREEAWRSGVGDGVTVPEAEAAAAPARPPGDERTADAVRRRIDRYCAVIANP